MGKERITFLDQAEGFAIFLMVFTHVIAWNLDNYQSILFASIQF